MAVKDDELKLREERRKTIHDLMSKHNISTTVLSKFSGISQGNISSYRNGKFPVTEKTLNRLKDAIDRITKGVNAAVEKPKEKQDPKPKQPNRMAEVIDEYIIQSLNNHGNSIVMKNKVKDPDKFIELIKWQGFNCRLVDTGSDHYVIEDKDKNGREFLTKVFQVNASQKVEDKNLKMPQGFVTDIPDRHEDENDTSIEVQLKELEQYISDIQATIFVTEDHGAESAEKRYRRKLEIFNAIHDSIEELKNEKGLKIEYKSETEDEKTDNVNHPSHYTYGKIETLYYIMDKLTPEEFKGYIKGNATKYVSREAHKNGIEDLRKAAFYLNFYIEHYEGKKDV